MVKGDFLLKLHDGIAPFFLHFLRNLIRESGRRSVFLRGVSEHAEALKLHLVHEFHQRLMILLRLSRESGYEGRTDCDIGNLTAEFTDDLL